MIRYLLLIYLIIGFITKTYSQDVKFFGDFVPGSLVFGNAENVKDVWLDKEKIQIDGSGNFVFGFDRDDKGSYLLKIKFTNGRVYLKKINLPERNYQIQRIERMNPDKVVPTSKDNEKIVKEREIIRNARKSIGKIDTAYYSSGFMKPVKTNRQTSVFGSQRILNGIPKNAHNGLDYGAPTGTPVYAMADGIVFLTGTDFFYNGTFVYMDHGQGLNSFYLHFSKLDVKDGEFVKKGQKIGEIGTSGRSTGPHLHWGVQWFNKRVDPALLLKINL